MARAWVVYSCRTAYTAEVLEIIGRRDETVEVIVDNIGGSEPYESELRVAGVADLADVPRDRATVVPLLTPGFRHQVVAEARAAGFSAFPALVDPTSVVARSAEVSEGVVVNAAAVIGANSVLREFVHVNRSASLGHDDMIEPFASIGPGCVFAGGVTVGRGAFVGAGAVCAPGVVIGANAVVGAGAVVVRDVEPGSTVVGNPARLIPSDGAGYRGVVVPER